MSGPTAGSKSNVTMPVSSSSLVVRYSIVRGRSGGTFSLPDGIGRRLMETSTDSGSAVECSKNTRRAASVQKKARSRSRKAQKQTGGQRHHRWIVKPATDACGHGIHIFDGNQVSSVVCAKHNFALLVAIE